MEYRFLSKDGSVVWVLDHATLIARSDEGDPSTFQGVMLDITAQRDAESKAQEAEDRFRTLTERGPVVMYSFELEYSEREAAPSVRVSYVSPHASELVGDPIEHRLDQPSIWFGMMHPDDQERVADLTARNWRTGGPWTTRYRIIRSDGTVIWLLDTGRLLDRDSQGRPWRFQGVMLDVTADEGGRAQLEAAEREQREALAGALVIPWTETIHPETGSERYTYIGSQAVEILGYSPEELMGEPGHFPRMVHPDDRTRVRETMERSEGTGLWEETYRVLRRDGEIRWLHSFGRRTSPPDVVPEVWQGVAVDVTAFQVQAPDVPAAEGGRAEAP
jgi:PAS domain S-box-containing protein